MKFLFAAAPSRGFLEFRAWGGPVLAALAMLVYSAHDIVVKWLALGAHPLWIFLWSQAGALTVAIIFMFIRHGALAWYPVRMAPVLLRAILGVATAIFAMAGIVSIPLTDVYAIVFLKPILACAIALALLGEAPSRIQMIAIILGSAGILLALGPFGQTPSWGHVWAFVAVLISSFGTVLTRSIARHDVPETVVVWTGAIGLLASLAGVHLLRVTAQWVVAGEAFAVGTLLGVGVLLWVKSLMRSTIAEVAPMQYRN